MLLLPTLEEAAAAELLGVEPAAADSALEEEETTSAARFSCEESAETTLREEASPTEAVPLAFFAALRHKTVKVMQATSNTITAMLNTRMSFSYHEMTAAERYLAILK